MNLRGFIGFLTSGLVGSTEETSYPMGRGAVIVVDALVVFTRPLPIVLVGVLRRLLKLIFGQVHKIATQIGVILKVGPRGWVKLFASARISIEPAIWSSGSSTRSSRAAGSQRDTTNWRRTTWLSFSLRRSTGLAARWNEFLDVMRPFRQECPI